ncbi:unnamed protein product [Cylicocyclus nassatus]|uniref:Uncharacterized protein n=1 Tax=Cylicocyclus nassatus TaxID=53992 RepID=A0AA36GJ83_CYLNA|nr:unnamed protein product [Cylicocyclus nassatus]
MNALPSVLGMETLHVQATVIFNRLDCCVVPNNEIAAVSLKVVNSKEALYTYDSLIYYAMKESAASQHATMTAMDGASKNAGTRFRTMKFVYLRETSMISTSLKFIQKRTNSLLWNAVDTCASEIPSFS